MKNILKTLAVALLALSASLSAAATDLDIIPAPSQVKVGQGNFQLKSLNIYIEPFDRSDDLAAIVGEKLQVPIGLEMKMVKAAKADIRFVKDASQPLDGYTLTVDNHGVTVGASGYGGYFYGLQTLLQLLPREIKSPTAVAGVDWTVPFVEIQDSPRFGWRGLMLDVSRHWFTKEEVLKYIDELAEYKMNIFHWHLTDDQGWRLQIESCPELTEKGCMRASRVGQWWTREPAQKGEPLDYGGFYTKEDVREVVEYAARRNVSVMPEIDVPGHSLAMLVAYPELACFEAPEFVNVGNLFYGKDENALCPGKEKTYEILEKVFREVAEMFPFEYVDIGGDECFRGFWEKSPECQELMKRENLKNTAELQSYFIRRMEKILAKYGKKIVGWDEIAEGGLAPTATVMSWRGMSGGIAAAKAGHHVIMTPFDDCYLDLYQGEPSVEPNTYAMLRLSTCYGFEPVPEGVNPSLILGGQGNLWGESVPNFRHAEYMTWPRGWALSEVFWSPASTRDWNDFLRRVDVHFLRAETADVNCSTKSVYNAIVTPTMDGDGVLRVTLESEVEGLEMHYSLDNTNPDKYAPLYTGPFRIPRNATWVKIQSYRGSEKVGNMLDLPVKTLIERVPAESRIFTNPVIAHDWADPTIWENGGTYYSVATGLKTIMSSKDMVHWADLGRSPITAKARAELFGRTKNIWAPCVTKIGNKWVLYVSLYVTDDKCSIAVMESYSPDGPFDWKGILIDGVPDFGIVNAIDPFTLVDNGRVWHFFGSLEDGVHLVELTPDGLKVKEGAQPVHVAGVRHPAHKFVSEAYEGTYVMKKNGWWYFFASGGAYYDETYHLVVARSRELGGPYYDREGNLFTEGKALPVLASQKGDHIIGPGHNGDVFETSDGRTYMYFHSHMTDIDPNDRYTLLQQVFWDEEGWPYFKDGKPAEKEMMPVIK